MPHSVCCVQRSKVCTFLIVYIDVCLKSMTSHKSEKALGVSFCLNYTVPPTKKSRVLITSNCNIQE